MNKIRAFLRGAAVALACALLSLIPVGSTSALGLDNQLAVTTPAYTLKTNYFYFEDFTVDYYLWRDEDGTSRMLVVEELTAVFPTTDQNHGINRVIPFTNQGGKNMTMPSDTTIYMDVKRNGVKEPVDKVEIGDGYFNVYIGDSSKFVHGRQVYRLEYEFENLITDFEDWQELYWDTNGNDWSQRFENLTARIHLDKEIAESFTGDTACYVGSWKSTNTTRCKTTKIEDGVQFSTEKLSARENLTFVMKFEPDTFALPTPHYDYRVMVMAVAMLISGAGMIILMIITVRSVSEKRRYYKGLFIKPEYTPPAGFTVAEMATNSIRAGANGNAKVATLLELAVQHKIEMVKTEKDGAFGKKKTVWKIRIVSADLAKEQVVILKILAGSNAKLQKGQEIEVKRHSANSSLISLANKFTTYVQKNLETKGLSEPTGKDENGKKTGEKIEKTRNYASILAVACAAWMFIWLFVSAFAFDDLPSYIEVIGIDYLGPIIIVAAVAIFVAGLVIAIRSGVFYTHTNKGLEYARYLDGLKLYIKMAESERLRFLQSVDGADTSHTGVVKLYEKLLPYAVIFRMEKSWLDEMSRYYEFDDVAAPNWYVGVGAFSAREFALAMSSASSTMNSMISYSTTSNSSSGGSGFSGGGFSGGGGGGGGGGGW